MMEANRQHNIEMLYSLARKEIFELSGIFNGLFCSYNFMSINSHIGPSELRDEHSDESEMNGNFIYSRAKRKENLQFSWDRCMQQLGRIPPCGGIKQISERWEMSESFSTLTLDLLRLVQCLIVHAADSARSTGPFPLCSIKMCTTNSWNSSWASAGL